MKHKDGSFRGGGVDLVKRGHTPFGELKLRPAADDTNPLRRRRPCRLHFQHAQCISERWHTVPAQLQVVIQSASDRMHMRIIETRDYCPPSTVNHPRCVTAARKDLVMVADRGDFSVLYRNRVDKGRDSV